MALFVLPVVTVSKLGLKSGWTEPLIPVKVTDVRVAACAVEVVAQKNAASAMSTPVKRKVRRKDLLGAKRIEVIIITLPEYRLPTFARCPVSPTRYKKAGMTTLFPRFGCFYSSFEKGFEMSGRGGRTLKTAKGR